MSNNANVYRTVFLSLNSSGEVVCQSYGVRISDDYGNGYTNVVDDFEALIAMSPAGILGLAYEIQPQGLAVIDYALEFDRPVWIDNVAYSIEQIDDGFSARPLSSSLP